MPGATFVASDRSVRSDALLLIFLPLQGGFLLGEHAAQYDGPVAARARHPAQGGRALGCKKSRVVCRTGQAAGSAAVEALPFALRDASWVADGSFTHEFASPADDLPLDYRVSCLRPYATLGGSPRKDMLLMQRHMQVQGQGGGISWICLMCIREFQTVSDVLRC